MRDVLTKREHGHHAAITDPKQFGALLRAIDDYNGSFIVKCALQLAPLFFVRPGELRKAEWSEFVRIPDESGHHSGGKAATVPTGIRPAFRFDCGHHSGAIRPV
jgi:integrase